jgi:hypothetical protein
LRALFRKEQVSQELDEELNGFLEMAVEEKMKLGMGRKDALRAVHLEQGTLEVTKEVVRPTPLGPSHKAAARFGSRSHSLLGGPKKMGQEKGENSVMGYL